MGRPTAACANSTEYCLGRLQETQVGVEVLCVDLGSARDMEHLTH